MYSLFMIRLQVLYFKEFRVFVPLNLHVFIQAEEAAELKQRQQQTLKNASRFANISANV